MIRCVFTCMCSADMALDTGRNYNVALSQQQRRPMWIKHMYMDVHFWEARSSFGSAWPFVYLLWGCVQQQSESRHRAAHSQKAVLLTTGRHIESAGHGGSTGLTHLVAGPDAALRMCVFASIQISVCVCVFVFQGSYQPLTRAPAAPVKLRKVQWCSAGELKD